MLLFSQITYNLYRFGATLNEIMSHGSKKEKNKLETKQKHFKFFLSSVSSVPQKQLHVSV